jgi:hypothetical protein
MDRQLDQVVHRTVAEDFRMKLDDSIERLGAIFDDIIVKN